MLSATHWKATVRGIHTGRDTQYQCPPGRKGTFAHVQMLDKLIGWGAWAGRPSAPASVYVFPFCTTHSYLSKGKYMKLGLPGYFYCFGCNFCLLRVMCAYTEELEMTPESVIVVGRRGVACKSQPICIDREVVRQLLWFLPKLSLAQRRILSLFF